MVHRQSLVPFFSIVTCTKNSAKYLPKCLTSLAAQTFRNFEHIVIDGQSSDQTTMILNESGVSYHTLAPRGIAQAMNRGLSYAGGQYVYFLNSDDSLYSPTVLQKVHDFLVAHPNLDWVFGKIHETDGVKTIGFPPKRRIFQAKHPNLLKFYNYIPHQGTFVKKSVFDKFGQFDESLKSMMDPEYWLRISDSTDWGYMPVAVANYLIRPDSQSENASHVQSNTREYEQVQAKYLSRLELLIAKIINKILR